MASIEEKNQWKYFAKEDINSWSHKWFWQKDYWEKKLENKAKEVIEYCPNSNKCEKTIEEYKRIWFRKIGEDQINSTLKGGDIIANYRKEELDRFAKKVIENCPNSNKCENAYKAYSNMIDNWRKEYTILAEEYGH